MRLVSMQMMVQKRRPIVIKRLLRGWHIEAARSKLEVNQRRTPPPICSVRALRIRSVRTVRTCKMPRGWRTCEPRHAVCLSHTWHQHCPGMQSASATHGTNTAAVLPHVSVSQHYCMPSQHCGCSNAAHNHSMHNSRRVPAHCSGDGCTLI